MELVQPLVMRRFGQVDLQRAGIEARYPSPGFLSSLPSSLFGLLLGELLSDRYSYLMDEVRLPDEIDVEEEKRQLLLMEERHSGPEHGPRRAYANSLLSAEVPQGAHLLDYGCGSGRYKDYYERCGSVTCVDVNLHALLHLRAFFPDREKIKVIWAPLGFADLKPGSFDCLMASALIGYVCPSVAERLVDEFAFLLAPRGRLILALVPALSYSEWPVGRSRLNENPKRPGAFHCKYSRRQLRNLLEKRGLRTLNAGRHLLKLPRGFVRVSTNRLYRHRPMQVLDRLLNSVVPGLSTWHILAAEKAATSK